MQRPRPARPTLSAISHACLALRRSPSGTCDRSPSSLPTPYPSQCGLPPSFLPGPQHKCLIRLEGFPGLCHLHNFSARALQYIAYSLHLLLPGWGEEGGVRPSLTCWGRSRRPRPFCPAPPPSSWGDLLGTLSNTQPQALARLPPPPHRCHVQKLPQARPGHAAAHVEPPLWLSRGEGGGAGEQKPELASGGLAWPPPVCEATCYRFNFTPGPACIARGAGVGAALGRGL